MRYIVTVMTEIQPEPIQLVVSARNENEAVKIAYEGYNVKEILDVRDKNEVVYENHLKWRWMRHGF